MNGLRDTMESYEARILALISLFEREFDIDNKISLIKRAINLADSNNDLQWGADLRLQLIATEIRKTRLPESFAALTWMLNVYETHPEFFDAEALLLIYKHMASVCFRYIDIPKHQIDNIFADFKSRLKKNGLGNRDYYDILISWNIFSGQNDEARRCLSEMENEPFDQINLEIAKPLEVAICLLEKKFDQAISIAENRLRDTSAFETEAMSMYFTLTYYLSKAKDNRAHLFFKKLKEEFEAIKEYNYCHYILPSIFMYLSLNNQQLAWHYFEKYAGLEIEGDETLMFDIALSLLPLLKGKNGSKELNLSPKAPYYCIDNIYNITDLYNYYYNHAYELAIRFDKRNGNNHFIEQLNEITLL